MRLISARVNGRRLDSEVDFMILTRTAGFIVSNLVGPLLRGRRATPSRRDWRLTAKVLPPHDHETAQRRLLATWQGHVCSARPRESQRNVRSRACSARA